MYVLRREYTSGVKNLLEYLITSKTRIKLLLKFFLNTEARGYLRSLAEEFGESTNAVRVELNRLLAAGLLDLKSEGRTKVYQANKNHVLFEEIHSIVKKYIGIDKLIENIVSKLGNVKLAFIIGDYAKGIDSGIIDLIIIGQVNVCYLGELVGKVEVLIKRKVKILVLNEEEFSAWKSELGKEQALCIWSNQQVLLEGTI